MPVLGLRRRIAARESAGRDRVLEKPFREKTPGPNARPTIRELWSTLIAALNDALLPIPLVKTPGYSSYLTQQVSGLTLGWQTLRVAVESSYLITHGVGFDTVVVQVFLACSATSLALHMLRRELWLRKREAICIGMNCMYGILTFLKVFSLVSRLPDETHYLFKHCLLSMADAFFCQVPVHKFYVAQFLDASLRCIVWRRYDVLPGLSTPLVVLVSLAWQAWILLFSAMLQARHVAAYLRRLPPQLAAAAATAAATKTTAAECGGSSGAGSKAAAKAAAVVLPRGWGGAAAAVSKAVPEQVDDATAAGCDAPAQRLLLSRLSVVSDSTLSSGASAAARVLEPPMLLVSASAFTSSELTPGNASSPPMPGAGGPPVPPDIALSSRNSSSRNRFGLSSSVRLICRLATPHGTDQDLAPGSFEASDCGGGGGVAAGGSGDSNNGTGSDSFRRRESFVLNEGSGGSGPHRAPVPLLSSIFSREEYGNPPAQPTDSLPMPMESPFRSAGVDLGRMQWLPPPSLPSSGSRSDTSSTAAAGAAAILSAPAAPAGVLFPRRRPSATSLLAPPSTASIAGSPIDASMPGRAFSGGVAAGGGRRSRQAEYALRRLVRGPSSYVLLSEQRKVDEHRSSVQICVTSANPDQLMAHWSTKLAAVVKEGAPGWHLVNSSVRKGSLIVHLDLVYSPPQHQQHVLQPSPQPQDFPQPQPQPSPLVPAKQPPRPAAMASVAATAKLTLAASPLPDCGCGKVATPGTPSFEGQPAAATTATTAGESSDDDLTAIVLEPRADASTEILERFLQGLGPSGLLNAMSLPEHSPATPGDYISVQHGSKILRYDVQTPPSSSAARRPAARVQLKRRSSAAAAASAPPPGGHDGTDGVEILEVASAGAGGGLQRRRGRRGRGDVGSVDGEGRRITLRPLRSVGDSAARGDGPVGRLEPPAPITTALAKASLLASTLYGAVHLAIRPPTLVSTPEFGAFLHARVAPLHAAYSYLMAALTATFCAYHAGIKIFNITSYMAPELLSAVAHAAAAAAGDGADRVWAAWRAPLVHIGMGLRGLLLLVTSIDLIPQVKKDHDCMEMRWVVKMLLISALHVLCMQTPVRMAFLVRLVPLVGAVMIHTLQCHPRTHPLPAVLLHGGWEALLFVVGALLQARHIAAFRRFHQLAAAGGSIAAGVRSQLAPCLSSNDAAYASPKCASSPHAAAPSGGRGANAGAGPTSEPLSSVTAAVAYGSGCASISTSATFHSAAASSDKAGTAAAAAPPHHHLHRCHPGMWRSHGGPDDSRSDVAAVSNATLRDAGTSAASGGEASEPLASLVWSSVGQWQRVRAGTADVDGAGVGEPWDISLDGCVLAMKPRRSQSLRLGFTCTTGGVEELQVILRHLSPASMASGTHTATAASKVVRTLAAPAAAHLAAAPSSPLRFDAELTVVAPPHDTPGVVHVELWRGHTRLAGWPVLLAPAETASPPPGLPAAAPEGPTAGCGGGGGGEGGAAADLPGWLTDVTEYVAAIKAEGHSCAADQYLEELGTWLAQLAALERGLMEGAAAVGGAGGGAADAASDACGPQIARVLWVHHAGLTRMGVGSACMARQQHLEGKKAAQQPPRKTTSRSGTGAAAAAAAADVAAVAAFRQLLTCQGQGLLAVAVEAGCLALSEYLIGVLFDQLGASVQVVLEGSVTPVTALPLLHAAVKSGNPAMVDLVVQWHARAGATHIWAREAVVRVCSMEVGPLHMPLPAGTAAAPRGASEAQVGPLWQVAAAGGGAGGGGGGGGAEAATAAAEGSALMVLGGDGGGSLLETSDGDVVVEGPDVAEAEAEAAEKELRKAFEAVLASGGSTVDGGGGGGGGAAAALTLKQESLVKLVLEHDSDLTGSFHLETNRQSLVPSNHNLSNLPGPTMAGATSALPATPPLSAPPPICPILAVVQPPSSPTLQPPRTLLATAAANSNAKSDNSNNDDGDAGGAGRAAIAATAAAIAASYTSSGVSVAAATAAAKLTATRCPDLAAELSAPFRVVSLRPNKDDAPPTAVQELPRNAKDAAEPGAAGCGLLPMVIAPDPRFIGALAGGSEPAGSLCGPYGTALPYGRSFAGIALAATPSESAGSMVAAVAVGPVGGVSAVSGVSALGVSAQQRLFVDLPYNGLVDGGLLLLTPLHVALALGDEGRIAAHIFATYPEANELWHVSQVHWLAATGASNIQSLADSSTMASPFVPQSVNATGLGYGLNAAAHSTTTANRVSAFVAARKPAAGTAAAAPPQPPQLPQIAVAGGAAWPPVLMPSGIGIRPGSSATVCMAMGGVGSSVSLFSLGGGGTSAATILHYRANSAVAAAGGGDLLSGLAAVRSQAGEDGTHCGAASPVVSAASAPRPPPTLYTAAAAARMGWWLPPPVHCGLGTTGDPGQEEDHIFAGLQIGCNGAAGSGVGVAVRGPGPASCAQPLGGLLDADVQEGSRPGPREVGEAEEEEEEEEGTGEEVVYTLASLPELAFMEGLRWVPDGAGRGVRG